MSALLKFCNPAALISSELGLNKSSIESVISLLNEGNTIPFIARYRKEATGNLDEVQIRAIQERYTYLVEMDERKVSILNSIESQGKLDEVLKNKIINSESKNTLEDLYLPFKPKRRTRATIAKEKGLEPLAKKIIELSLDCDPLLEAEKYIDLEKGVETVEDALAGARDIVAEIVSENAEIRGFVRNAYMEQGVVISKVKQEHIGKPGKFSDYYEFSESVAKIPSHRYLAIRRGEKEGVLIFSIAIPEEENVFAMEKILNIKGNSPFKVHYQKAVADSFRRLIQNSVETDVRIDLKMKSDISAVEVFAQNLKNILLSSPLGSKSVIGIDPGLRTGCKCAVVGMNGDFICTETLYLVKSDSALNSSKETLIQLVRRYQPYAIGIGNGTAGRETEAFVRSALKEAGLSEIIVVPVNEAGASVYSASDVAREEFPDLDLTIRGAISIARRLQDPLAEIVKVDPKAIGIGQYQHDVHQPLLQQKLKEVVESCVNHVGVELNTASAELLSYVSGIGSVMAKKIIAFRSSLGKFSNRKQLLDVPGLGDKTFQQAAGFLRIRNGDNPLDASAVHPESYAVVEKMSKDLGLPLSEIIGNANAVHSLVIDKYLTDKIGKETLDDIIQELKKPGRDPRSSFVPPNFREDVNSIGDLKVGMRLEGVVTNVAAFGAFVDVGVHQDGLVHISDLCDHFVKDPHDVVKAGDKIKVVVLDVDIERKRISLSAKSDAAPRGDRKYQSNETIKDKDKGKVREKSQQRKFTGSPFANL